MSEIETEMRETQFSPCRKYRYELWREWGTNSLFCGSRYDQFLLVIGLNPSTADETQDDPTIRRCIDFAKRWGFGSLCMMNLFAWRATKPEDMMVADEPIGENNGAHLVQRAEEAGMILAAWGKHGGFKDRQRNVLSALSTFGKPIYCLRKNRDGSPQHPLYVPATTIPVLI